MTTVRPSDAAYTLDRATLSLMVWLADTCEKVIKPDVQREVGDAWETLDHVWVLIQNKIGWYREKSFALNAEDKKMFASIEHNMKLVKVLYGPKEG
jgi:hypothetical protein